MSSFYSHFCWFLFIFTSFLCSFLISFFVSFSESSYFTCVSLFSLSSVSFDLSFFIDSFSSWFTSVILIISSVIIIYSYFYMSPYYKSAYFLWITFLFVLSMLLVVSMSNLFFIILGWDGLGVVSFFLIVYYQNFSSVLSGVFTLLINRFGDGLFILSICGSLFLLPDLFPFFSLFSWPFYVSVIFLLGLSTNSALFPFSSWLPIAISAPTPISALVHSSTLVTSGLYLIMRFSYVFYYLSSLLSFLMFCSIFTSLYAGLNSVFEVDIKNLIALSTLSHLGFIGLAFSCGLTSLSFFHLLAHALFKSLLFMTMGDIIINLNHSQDIRYLSSGALYTPFSVCTMFTSLLSLLGLPSVSGFFSNDLVLESFWYCDSSFFLCFLVYVNVFFTYFYTFKLFSYSFASLNVSSFQLIHLSSFLHSFLILVLSLFSISFGNLFLSLVCPATLFVVIPFYVNALPFIISSLLFFYILLFLGLPITSLYFPSLYFSTMLYLTPFVISVISVFYFNVLFRVSNDIELGLPNNFIHSFTTTALTSVLNTVFSFYNNQVLFLFIFSFFGLSVLFLW